MLVASNLLKLIPFGATYKPISFAPLAPEGPDVPPVTITVGPISETFNPPFSSFPHYDVNRAYRRDLAFESFSHSGKLLKCNRNLPVVGNLLASLEVLGLRGFNLGDFVGDEFATLERGARQLTTESESFTIWETSNYFGKPGGLLKTPRVVLISADETGLTLGNLEDLIDDLYETVIDPMQLLVILDKSRAISYNPYLYGLPLNPHLSPETSPVAPMYTAGELLVIHFNPWDFELLANPAGATPGYESYNATRGSYYVFFPGSVTNHTVGAGDGDAAFAQDLQDVGSVIADAAAWTSAESFYNRRRHIIHCAEFATPNDEWYLYRNQGTVPAPPTMGPAPHGYGSSYISATKPPLMQIGRTYDRTGAFAVPSPTDMLACISEDISAFFS